MGKNRRQYKHQGKQIQAMAFQSLDDFSDAPNPEHKQQLMQKAKQISRLRITEDDVRTKNRAIQ